MKKSGRFVFLRYHEKIISGIGFILRCEIVKTKPARAALQIASFSWSILSSTIALSQSAPENSDSYCKNYCGFVFTTLSWKPLQSPVSITFCSSEESSSWLSSEWDEGREGDLGELMNAVENSSSTEESTSSEEESSDEEEMEEEGETLEGEEEEGKKKGKVGLRRPMMRKSKSREEEELKPQRQQREEDEREKKEKEREKITRKTFSMKMQKLIPTLESDGEDDLIYDTMNEMLWTAGIQMKWVCDHRSESQF